MSDNKPTVKYAKDYRESPFFSNKINLKFDLYEDYSDVTVKFNVIKNRKAGSDTRVVLNGENLELLYIKVNDVDLTGDSYSLDDKSLSFIAPSDSFEVELSNRIYPQNNKSLEGLYKSQGMFCTQNEPEGFRKIVYFFDRSDVMSSYSCKISADKKKYPQLLANGNIVKKGELADGRHFATWEDPFKKPSYLFAMVAGDMALVTDTFITMSGREIALHIYVDHGNEGRVGHAMASLKKAMRWDEEKFGREYDLDIFMIVAVDDFNFGAMENKGLNIFNSALVLADPETETDDNFERIEGVVAHEYFHNWTGNRITLRDWFQLTLKEGLTVFRDQEFSADMGSRSVNRILNMRAIKEAQFIEDSGPMSHAIRPASYIEINNFYTVTVYEKGAEVIRMVHTLLGEDYFRKGMDSYFKLYDGQAVTTDDFISAMESGAKYDLLQFKNWYDQAGTPLLKIKENYDSSKKRYTLEINQSIPSMGEKFRPLYIPFKMGLLDETGKDIPLKTSTGSVVNGDLLILENENEKFVFENIEQKPTPSYLRNFSAPVKIESNLTNDAYIFLAAHDSDPLNRYVAVQKLATDELLSLYHKIKKGEKLSVNEKFLDSFGKIVIDENVDPTWKSIALLLPSISALDAEILICDYELLYKARKFLKDLVAARYLKEFKSVYDKHCSTPYSGDQKSIANRSWKNRALSYIVAVEKDTDILSNQYFSADNMTDRLTAFSLISDTYLKERDNIISDFYDRYRDDLLVMNKWLAVLASSKRADTLQKVKVLEDDPVFDIKNPNKIRSLIGAFGVNHLNFHREGGAGYSYLTDKIIYIDKYNPMSASRLAGCFRKYKKYDDRRKSLVRIELERILRQSSVSKDLFEIVSKTLKSGE